MKNRDITIDILKGIGITLVLVTHSLGGLMVHFAYTFHMPLFFIIAGLFISDIPKSGEQDPRSSFFLWWRDRIWKDFKRLINPALFTVAVIFLVSCLSYVLKDSYLQNPVSLIWNDTPQGKQTYVNMLGNLWFLFALFFAKQLFYVLEHLTGKRLLAAVCLVVGLAAVIIRQWFDLPFEVLGGASVLPFVWGGYYLKKNGGVEAGLPRWFYLTIPFWMSFIFWGKGRIGAMPPVYYTPYIISACGGTLFFYHVSKAIAEKTTYLSRCLSFLGVYSLILISAPTIETYCFPMQVIIPQMPMRFIFVITGKVAWCALAVYCCLKVPLLKKVFGVK